MSIEIRGLTITIGDKPIVRDACMDIADGERIGLVGSSGSGKSMIAKALMGLLPDTARVSGSIMAGGRQLIGLDDTAMADLRGRYMGMVFQNPAAVLNPVMTVAQQIGLPLYLHYDLSLDERLDRVKAMLDKVGLSQDALLKYPHQLSGGQQQRVGIATALITSPRFIIAARPCCSSPMISRCSHAPLRAAMCWTAVRSPKQARPQAYCGNRQASLRSALSPRPGNLRCHVTAASATVTSEVGNPREWNPVIGRS